MIVKSMAVGPIMANCFIAGCEETRQAAVIDPGAESDRILPLLLAHVADPVFQCRHRWTPGCLTMWDNRCVQHYAVPDYTSRRIMHRLTVAGDEPR